MKPQFDEPLSNFGFKFNLIRYILGDLMNDNLQRAEALGKLTAEDLAHQMGWQTEAAVAEEVHSDDDHDMYPDDYEGRGAREDPYNPATAYASKVGCCELTPVLRFESAWIQPLK